MKEYTQNFKVKIADCDMRYRMTLGTCLRYVQQVANEHGWEMGFSKDFHERTHSYFVIAKAAAICHKVPVFAQEIKITTQVAFTGRVQIPRYTVIKDAKTDEVLIEVTSIWAIVDTESRRLFRRLPEEISNIFEKWDITVLDLRIQKTEIVSTNIEKATFLRCDENMHINNTNYADIIYDYIPFDVLKEQEWKRFVVSYHNEIPALAEFELKCGEVIDNKYYFSANIEDKNCFEAQVEF